MKALKKLLGAFALVFGLAAGNPAHAGIPVIDGANLAQAIQQVTAWAQQYQQMVEQIEQMQQAYNNLNGVRNMGSLVNNPVSRKYLPDDYQTILSNGVGQWEAIRDAAKKSRAISPTWATSAAATAAPSPRPASCRASPRPTSGPISTSPVRPGCREFEQSWQAYGLTLAMAVFSTVAPVWLVSEAIRRLGAGQVSLTGTLGPAITIGLGWLLLDEAIGPAQLAGAAMVIAGVATRTCTA